MLGAVCCGCVLDTLERRRGPISGQNVHWDAHEVMTARAIEKEVFVSNTIPGQPVFVVRFSAVVTPADRELRCWADSAAVVAVPVDLWSSLLVDRLTRCPHYYKTGGNAEGNRIGGANVGNWPAKFFLSLSLSLPLRERTS